MGQVVNQLKSFLKSYLIDHRYLNSNHRDDLMRWLLGKNLDKLEGMTTEELSSVTHAIIYRYRILRTYYLGIAPKQAYRHLFNRFGAIMMKYSLLRHWMTSSQEHQRTAIKTFEAMIEYLLEVDSYLRSQRKHIALCTEDSSLRNALLLTTIELYCLNSIDDHPWLLHLLSYFLGYQQDKQQITPQQDQLLKLVSREIAQKPLNTETLANFYFSTLPAQSAQIFGQQAFKSYLEAQLAK